MKGLQITRDVSLTLMAILISAVIIAGSLFGAEVLSRISEAGSTEPVPTWSPGPAEPVGEGPGYEVDPPADEGSGG